jgi:hypothetical protein
MRLGERRELLTKGRGGVRDRCLWVCLVGINERMVGEIREDRICYEWMVPMEEVEMMQRLQLLFGLLIWIEQMKLKPSLLVTN